MELVISDTCVGVFVVYLHMKFHIPSTSISLGSHQTEVQKHLAMSTSWHFTLKSPVTKSCVFIQYPFWFVFDASVGHGLLTHEVSRSHTTTHHSR